MTVTEREIQGLPSFKAKGEVVDDRKLQEKLREVFARKYADEWTDYEHLFKFEDGSRVVVRYIPVA